MWACTGCQAARAEANGRRVCRGRIETRRAGAAVPFEIGRVVLKRVLHVAEGIPGESGTGTLAVVAMKRTTE
jgi:hypothetical protein